MTAKSLFTSVLVSAAALAAHATPAHANDCVDEAIAQCDKRYPLSSTWLTPMRGYCYLILAGGCLAADQT